MDHCSIFYETLSYYGLTGCPYGPDKVWGIVWPNIAGGRTNTQPCPGGVDALGMLLLTLGMYAQ